MSSYSEYLGRMKQRMVNIQDTRPHRDAGHQTEVVKRLAAAGVQESKTPASAGVTVLDGPSTRVTSFYAEAHTVQDTSRYNEFTAGQAVAQSALPRNAKTSQITATCYAPPEYNDLLRTDAQAALKQDAKNKYARGYSTAACCLVCGKPPSFDSGCGGCGLTAAQRNALKSKVAPLQHTAS